MVSDLGGSEKGKGAFLVDPVGIWWSCGGFGGEVALVLD
jgi:hypothetical protein